MYAQWIDPTDEQSPWIAFSQGFRPESDDFQEAADRIHELWRLTPDDVSLSLIESIWLDHCPDRSPRFLMELIKTDQAHRLKARKNADLDFYLSRFPELRCDDVRIVSLAYAEYCAREELGVGVSVDSFCEKYGEWGDSIRRQLALHAMLSVPSNELCGHEQARHFPKAGECIEHFELIRELGRGGSARVFLAHDLSLGRRSVALKISGDRSTEPEILARLDNDNIVPVHSVHDAKDGLRLICMPYRGDVTLDRIFGKLFAEGRAAPLTAREFLALIEPQNGGHSADNAQVDGPEGGWSDFPARDAYFKAIAWIGWKLAGALAHAHSLEVFHRDIKPANVLISRKSGPQLLDFNMARDPEAVQTVEDRIRGGTLPYMAPEQLAAFIDATLWTDIRGPADIYSLGLVLQEFLRGKRVEVPLAGNVPVQSQVRALLRQRSLPWISLRVHNPRIPHALDAIIAKASAFRPVDRYRSADQFAEDLQLFLANRPLKYAFNPSRRERIATFVRPAVKPVLAFATILMAFAIMRQSESAQTTPPTIPGIDQAVARAFSDNDFKAASALLDKPAEKGSETTSRELMRVIARIESHPNDPQAAEGLKALVLKVDLEQAINQVRGLIGENRHLDFLLVFRDFCRLSNEKSKNPPGNIEWQNLEMRFLRMIEKWPNDIRPYGFAAHLAAMRSDYLAAKNHAKKGLDLLDKNPIPASDPIRNDLENRFIANSNSQGLSHLRAGADDEALAEFRESESAIGKINSEVEGGKRKNEPSGIINLLEFQTRIGIGDSLHSKQQFEEALVEYERAANLLKRYGDRPRISQNRSKFDQQLNDRFSNLKNIDNNSGLLRPAVD